MGDLEVLRLVLSLYLLAEMHNMVEEHTTCTIAVCELECELYQ